MKRYVATLFATLLALAVAGHASAQGRHDEKPHGMTKAAPSTTTDQAVPSPSGTGGRHDEKPHGPKTTKAKKAQAPATKAGADAKVETQAPATKAGADAKVAAPPSPTAK